MVSYLLKHKLDDDFLIEDFVIENLGIVEYKSPVLPIMGVKITEEVKYNLTKHFDLEYIIEEPMGTIQDIDGSLSSVQKNSLVLVPSLPFTDLRKIGCTGWGSNVAVLDSGISEPWVYEHNDLTGFGSAPILDHGTKVANIIKSAAPGSNILSFKVTQDGTVRGTDFLNGLNLAVTKADILNISIGFDMECSSANPCSICEHVNYYSQNNGILFVVAAGNHGRENSVQCPGNSQETITVGSIKPYSKELADYSSRGVAGIKNPNILSTGTIYFNQREDYGTSYATPIITGVCATLLPSLGNVPKLKSILYSGTIDLGLPEHHQGFGLLDLKKLLEVYINDKGNAQSQGQGQS